jgi:hypothetical protein
VTVLPNQYLTVDKRLGAGVVRCLEPVKWSSFLQLPDQFRTTILDAGRGNASIAALVSV